MQRHRRFDSRFIAWGPGARLVNAALSPGPALMYRQTMGFSVVIESITADKVALFNAAMILGTADRQPDGQWSAIVKRQGNIGRHKPMTAKLPDRAHALEWLAINMGAV